MAKVIKFALVGHVDHGKSTLSGRILVDTGTVTKREAEKAREDAERNKMGSWWLAYLLDVDDEERRKGKTHDYMTIDMEHDGNKMQLIDVPGHRQFVQNMIKGTSFADVAVLVVSGRNGELDSGLKGQTVEHLTIVRGMGVSSVIICVNKMDHPSINWDLEKYLAIKKKILQKTKRLRFKHVTVLPCSALEGINIVKCPDPAVLDLSGFYDSGAEQQCLLDQIVASHKEAEIREEVIYPNVVKIQAQCIFVGITGIISKGWECNMHTADLIVDCRVIKIKQGNTCKPFITAQDSGAFTVFFELEKPTDVRSYAIFRVGDYTVGIGKIVKTVKQKLSSKN